MIHNEKYHLFPIITLIHNKLTLKLLLLMIYLILNWKDYVLKLCIRAHILRHEISLKLLPIIQIVNCLELLTFLASLFGFLFIACHQDLSIHNCCVFISVICEILSEVLIWSIAFEVKLQLCWNKDCTKGKNNMKILKDSTAVLDSQHCIWNKILSAKMIVLLSLASTRVKNIL